MSNENEDVVGSMTPVLEPTHELMFKAAVIVEGVGDDSLAESLRIRGKAMERLRDELKRLESIPREPSWELFEMIKLAKQATGLIDIPMSERASP